MLYNNTSVNAVLELERQRTGNYGEDYEGYVKKEVCENCGNENVQLFDINSQIICDDCVCEYFRNEFVKIFENASDKSQVGEVFFDIISDFSDNELLYYIENRCRKQDY